MTRAEALDILRAHSRDFARCYVALVEALLHEGVPEEVARFEARCMAAAALDQPAQEDAWRR